MNFLTWEEQIPNFYSYGVLKKTRMLEYTSKPTTRHASTEELQMKYPTLFLCI